MLYAFEYRNLVLEQLSHEKEKKNIRRIRKRILASEGVEDSSTVTNTMAKMESSLGSGATSEGGRNVR